MSVPPGARSPMFAFSAAGCIATSTLGTSPGVRMSKSAMCTWNADTPASVPAGARISAGKSGSVDRSLPKIALALVKRSPVSCMPSPESPAKRMTTRSSSWRGCSAALVSVTEARPFERGRLTRPWYRRGARPLPRRLRRGREVPRGPCERLAGPTGRAARDDDVSHDLRTALQASARVEEPPHDAAHDDELVVHLVIDRGRGRVEPHHRHALRLALRPRHRDLVGDQPVA